MTNVRTLALAAFATFGLLATVSTEVQAAPPQVLAGVIRNDAPFTVTYQYKFGKGVWITKTLPPGHAHQYSIALPAPNGLDTTITLHWCDSTTKVRRVTYTTTPLCMWVTNTPANGWPHRFILVNDGTKIHLTK